MSELKPCPFILVEKDIGHNPYVIETDEGWHIQCTCGARSPLSPVKEYAVKNWNCRQHDMQMAIEAVESTSHKPASCLTSTKLKILNEAISAIRDKFECPKK